MLNVESTVGKKRSLKLITIQAIKTRVQRPRRFIPTPTTSKTPGVQQYTHILNAVVEMTDPHRGVEARISGSNDPNKRIIEQCAQGNNYPL